VLPTLVAKLRAHVPICKQFRNTTKTPYPNVYHFKSSIYDVCNIEQLYEVITTAASEGACLLKGTLDRPLEWESRAGHTNAYNPTSWVCLDIDNLQSIASIDDFLQKIFATDTSYILQWSASYGIHGNYDIRAHLFFLLDQPAMPSVLKEWLKQLNLQQFPNDLTLTKTDMALHWGLDITTCQSDKLIFVAPPICQPASICHFTGQRISLVKKTRDYLTIPNLLTVGQIEALERTKIDELRKAKGLEPRGPKGFKVKDFKHQEYLSHPDQAQVTGVKYERDYVYLNLNGGDSWGYWHPKDNPTFIYNFKGEPVYRTQELVPEYWFNTLHSQTKATLSLNQNKILLAFRDFNTALYYNGWYDEATEELTLNTARSERQIVDFLINHGQPVPEAIPLWNVIYDPLLPVLDPVKQEVNLFHPSSYMREALNRAHHNPFPTIDRLCQHVVGQDCLRHWYNWLAFVYQQRIAPTTAWVWHGVPGIGKGVLLSKVLTPLFSPSNVVTKRMEELEDRFNGHLENCLICFVDEAQVSDSGRSRIIMSNLKNQITEPKISIRRMHKSSYEAINRVAWIFASNMPDAVIIATNDRRFNVGEFQSKPIQLTAADFVAIEAELQDFAVFLRLYEVDQPAVRTPLMNNARQQLILTSQPSADIVGQALLQNNLSLLWESLPSGPYNPTSHAEQDAYYAYKKLLYEIVKERRDKLTREELHTIFNFCIGNVPSSPNKLTSYLRHHGIQLKTIRVATGLTKGIEVPWQEDPAWFFERLQEIVQAEQLPTTLKVVK
jgi:hypothetical protein